MASYRKLLQLHWQCRVDLRKTVLVAQGGPFCDHDAFQAWVDGVLERQQSEMPTNYQVLICTEDSFYWK